MTFQSQNSFKEKDGQMGFASEKETQKAKALGELEGVISKAIKKVGGSKENDICKYLPMNSGGYMHHFTMRKMKFKAPSELLDLIKKYIINVDKPSRVKPKPRAARGSRKRRDNLTFSKTQIERLLNIARLAGDKEMIAILSPKKSLAAYKRELIQSIRQGMVDQELWNGYVEAVNAHQTILASAGLDLRNPLEDN
ncbi:MAG: hypothetical protein MRY21_07450 [Simkaniaceae bacterium]|nr:hypothetical protein [Simkaniaceae bacterium]